MRNILMRTSIRSYWFQFALALIAIASTSVGYADEKQESARERLVRQKRLSTIAKTRSPVEGFESVEMFKAMADGEIAVVIKTKDERDANLVVTNKSKRPLAIKMPSAFSAVPIMRQGVGGLAGGGMGGGMGGMGGGMGGMGGGMGMGGMGGGQGIGGGFGGGMGGGMGGMGGGMGGMGGGGVFNIPPGKSGRLSVKTICLEEGKPNPRSRMNYVIQPLDKLNSDPRIEEICRMIATDEIAQPIAQAAAWNITDGISWQELLVKNRIERMDGSFVRYFHPYHIQMAQRVVQVAAQRAEQREKANKDYSAVSQGYEFDDNDSRD
jgi:hypothetical protein